MDHITDNWTDPKKFKIRHECLMLPLQNYTYKWGLPDIFAAYRLLDREGETVYAHYLVDFQIRNPVMWYLFYRWWFFFSAPKAFRQYLPQVIRAQRIGRRLACLYTPYWVPFAKYHPVLFLIWLVLYSLFQLLVKALTAPIEMCYAARTVSSAPSEDIVVTDLNDELVIERSEVPT